MGINIDRFQQRTGEKSWWSNLGVHELRENDGYWVDVLPPPRKRDLKVLPYIIGGVSETGTDGNEYTARIGGDVRYEVTPQLRLIGTAKPWKVSISLMANATLRTDVPSSPKAEIYTDLTDSSTPDASLIWMPGLTSSAR